MANDLVLRCQFASFMQTGTSNTTPTYSLIGEGFTSFPESKNAKEYTRKYINYRTEKTDVIGYAPSMAYSCDLIADDPVVEKIVDITDNELVGNDAHVTIVNVNLWDEVPGQSGTPTGEYVAYKRDYAVIPDTKGDGTDALIYTGTLKACSDIVKGKFDLEDKTFTADS